MAEGNGQKVEGEEGFLLTMEGGEAWSSLIPKHVECPSDPRWEELGGDVSDLSLHETVVPSVQ